MVLKKNKIIGILIITLFMTILSCEDMYIINCDDCQSIEPLTCSLTIRIDELNGINTQTITVYKGKVDDGVIIFTTETLFTQAISVNLNSEYTAISTFTTPEGIEYTAVDSARPRVKIKTDYCEKTCYYVVDTSIDLRIKYY